MTTIIHQINKQKYPVVLMDGTRKLPKSAEASLIKFAEKITKSCPKAIFRTGNASGTDETFAHGVAIVNPAQLEYVIPYRTMRKSKLKSGARVISLEDFPDDEKNRLKKETLLSYPYMEKLIDHYFSTGIVNKFTAKAIYLLRDTLKVIGSTGLALRPSMLGIFYVNPEKPLSGGTGHTIRVCKQNNVTVLDQSDWLK